VCHWATGERFNHPVNAQPQPNASPQLPLEGGRKPNVTCAAVNAGSSWVIPLCRLSQLMPTLPASSVMSTSDHTASADGGRRHAHSRPLRARRQMAGDAHVK
jgi:hypothetical protein